MQEHGPEGAAAAKLAPQRSKAAKVLIVGLAYKKNVDDTRESLSLKLMQLIEDRGGVCDFHDPLVPVVPRTREHAAFAGRKSVPLDATTVLIATDHDAIDYKSLVGAAKLVIDTRNACARAGAVGSNVVKA